jgi:glycosyltransferase involved in cell wall biosynthesis
MLTRLRLKTFYETMTENASISMRILYVHGSFVPPPTNVKTDRFFLLSEKLEGDVIQPVWFKTPEEIEAVFGPGSYPVHQVGRFRYHWCFAWRYKGARGKLYLFWSCIAKGLQLCRSQRYDCIIAYSHMTTALCGCLIKLLTGNKLIIEVATSPEYNFLENRPKPTLRERCMHLYSTACLHVTGWLSDRAHLLYPEQFASYPLIRNTPSSVFHEFVNVAQIDRIPGEKSERFILMVGTPWFLKGTDLLIQAFRRVSPEFPGLKLKIVGFLTDRTELDALAGGSPEIEILNAVPHSETLKIIQEAMILVLPSRTEGMGRVLIEAMAAGVPLIGSDVGGIPYTLRDGQSGLLFRRGDVSSLEQRLREMLRDADLRRRMGEDGYRRAHAELNESVYVEQFARMVEAAANGKK